VDDQLENLVGVSGVLLTPHERRVPVGSYEVRRVIDTDVGIDMARLEEAAAAIRAGQGLASEDEDRLTARAAQLALDPLAPDTSREALERIIGANPGALR
jgi:hypothetical protein